MKFARTFDEILEGSNFPPEWQVAAIRYRQLKKCIRRVQGELAELGLDLKSLKALISEQEQQGGGAAAGARGCEDEKQPMLQYMFDGTLQRFQPKLVLTMYDQDGLRFVLGLSEETKRSLEKLLESRGIPRVRAAEVEVVEENDCLLTNESEDDSETVSSEGLGTESGAEESPASTIEIPLNHDSEFFHILTSELVSLDEVQSQAARTLEGDIVAIGNSVTAISAPTTLVSTSDLYPWREIFRIYLESGIFFSTLEMESHKERTAEEAQSRLQKFVAEVERLSLQKRFKHRNSPLLFARFIAVNEQVLKVLQFQAINKMAMQKILKKFDKRTALGVSQTYPTLVASNPFLASQLSKAICYTMSSKIVTIIPQLDDYLCPICQSISIKPVRLSCSHVFCVRCLVKLQREAKRFCPMCRGDVVMEADASNLDIGLFNFLRNYFPKESKEKQKENEREVVQEQWRNVHMRTERHTECVIM